MLEPNDALILLVPVLPIAIWASLSDLRTMKIPNTSVLAMAAVWPVIGWLLVPWTAWFWGFALMAIVFVGGFLMYLTGSFGAGDAKYSAAMAVMFVGADPVNLGLIIVASMLGALILHRIARAIPAIRNRTPDWLSWTRRRYFPFGLALSGIVLVYLIAAIVPQV